MSTGYTTYQQHEPLRAPSGWSTQEKRFVAQLEELFDDIYKRYNRLRMEDMSPAFRKSFKQIMDDGTELRNDLDITAAGLSAEITRATTAEGTLSSSISGTASAMELTFKKIGASGYTAAGITTITENGITVRHSSLSNCYTEMSASGFTLRDSNNVVIGGLMNLNGSIVSVMNTLHNPSYPNFKADVGSYIPRDNEGTNYGVGISLKYENSEFMHLGKNIYQPGYALYNELYSANGLFLSVNGGLTIERIYGASIFFTSDGDIAFNYRRNGRSYTKKISNLAESVD